MRYQQILKDNLERRARLNPRFSLRAYAKLLGLTPSKLSEILAGKKGLSADRALDVCKRLKLASNEQEIFLLSVDAQHSRMATVRAGSSKKLKEREQAAHSAQTRTLQKNAWYFGVVQAVKQASLGVDKLRPVLKLTALQIENAERYLARMHRFSPERCSLTYEPLSVLKKVNDDFSSSSLKSIDAEFAFLTANQAASLQKLLRAKINEFAAEAKPDPRADLCMFAMSLSIICRKEDLC